jgi:hypothetical protein
MFRKVTLGLIAAAALTTGAMSPASAHGWHGGWHGGWGRGPVVTVYAGPGYGGCTVRRWVYTPYGPALR